MTDFHRQFIPEATHTVDLDINDVTDVDELDVAIDLAKWARIKNLLGREENPDSVVGRVAQFKALRFQNPGIFLRAELPANSYSLSDIDDPTTEGLAYFEEMNEELVGAIRKKYGIEKKGKSSFKATATGISKRKVHTTDQNFAFVEFSHYRGAKSIDSTYNSFPNEYRLFMYGLDNGMPRGDVDMDELLANYEK